MADDEKIDLKAWEAAYPDTLVLKLTRNPWRIDIGGSIKDVDVALAILNQAKAFFELQRYFVAVEDHQRAMSLVQSGMGQAPPRRNM